MSEMDVAEIEVSIQELRKKIDLSDSLRRLEGNKDFRNIIIDTFLGSEASRLVKFKYMHHLDEHTNTDIDNRLIAIGKLNAFLSLIHQEGRVASDRINDYNEELANARTENSGE